jgi:chromosome segregation protein
MKFARLRLSGFKSFVEPTDLEIKPGLTGVVGPNGCGKSNLLEALRWVMGESSYKSMRASGMDDVIFSGTSARPARNTAEVVVTMDNSDHSAPPMYNAEESIEISRRIEREAGSAYRINGKDSRARDVQLLFADASTGARSPALVRQGQISELISAKPQNRRKILEEAAGISGLHTRRHDAELKLRAAETNLTRLDDVTAQLESQLNSLKRQARQAIKYKDLSSEIRKFESASLYTAWREASGALEKCQAEFDEVVRLLAGFTRAVSEKTRQRDLAAEKLPKLRENETVRVAVLQRLTIEREGLEREEEQAGNRRRELEGRLAQIEQDLAREKEILGDVDGAIERLDGERKALSENQSGESQARTRAAHDMQQEADKLATAQEKADQAGSKLSEITARRASLERTISELQNRLERLTSEITTVTGQREKIMAESGGKQDLENLGAAVEAAVASAASLETSALSAESELKAAREAESTARKTFDEARSRSQKLTTEVQTLTKLLNVNDGDLWPPVIDALKVEPGFETALGAALGDDIDAPTDESAPVHWRQLEALDGKATLPQGVEPLSKFVSSPRALDRRLDHIGIVEAADGPRLQSQLLPGQRLVSKDGGLWRWDGFSAAADAPTAAAKRLAERNRLGSLQEESEQATQATNKARSDHEAARLAVEAAIKKDQQARSTWRTATQAVDQARGNLATRERSMSEQLQQASALEEAGRRVKDSKNEVAESLEIARTELAEIPDVSGLESQLQILRDKVNEARAAYSESRARHDGLEREARMRADRLRAIEAETRSWGERTEKANEQIAVLTGRREKTRQELADQADMPKAFEEKRKKLLSALADAEKQRKVVGDELAVAETALREAENILRTAETELGKTREQHARLEALSQAATERKSQCRQRIVETLECKPEEVIERAQLDAENLPAQDVVEQKLTALRNQRERLGGVNLRAETEAVEVAENLDELVNERDDVISAVNKLRHGIGSLNKEGRQRLLEAFDTVNENFGQLFTRLFGGGKAQLQLVESDDPLEAGLEILANPPGKRPTTLSLLSGGEQALTAMALIFAVFLTNPSPICVLDEVDAPLDDHNVERFCNMLDAMLEKSETRFLIITHHALTMARMNRLYGVTMMERGVSQLVSVDLETAERLREAV